MKKQKSIGKDWEATDVIVERAPYTNYLRDAVVVRRINDKIDEVLLYKDHDVLFHLEELDKGVINIILYYGEKEKRFSIVSKSEINIIEQ